jgi:hypothetical protein
VERVAVRAALLLRLRNTVPRKMATVTHSTPKFPQKIPLQPELPQSTDSSNAVRVEACPRAREQNEPRPKAREQNRDDIHPPAGIRTTAIPDRSRAPQRPRSRESQEPVTV